MSLSLLFILTKKFLDDEKIADDHGWKHAETATRNAAVACVEELIRNPNIPSDLILASTNLHDTDDRKIFKTKNYSNARRLLTEAGYNSTQIEAVVEMISLVAASSNGNSIVEPRWKLIPRDADRVECIGEIGVWRCYIYTLYQKRPIALSTTPIVTNMEELAALDIPKRFANYVSTRGESASMFDHFYDKLLAVQTLSSGNTYLQTVADARYKYMCEWLFDKNQMRKDKKMGDVVEKFWSFSSDLEEIANRTK